MKKFGTFFIISLLLCSVSLTAGAKIIVEDEDTSFFRTIYAPEDKPVRKNNSTVKAYKASLSRKIFGEQPSLILVDLDNAGNYTELRIGQYLAVRVDEQDSTSWNFDSLAPNLRFIKKEKRNGVLIMLYYAVDSGSSKLNFDLMRGNRALLSRFLDVRVI